MSRKRFLGRNSSLQSSMLKVLRDENKNRPQKLQSMGQNYIYVPKLKSVLHRFGKYIHPFTCANNDVNSLFSALNQEIGTCYDCVDALMIQISLKILALIFFFLFLCCISSLGVLFYASPIQYPSFDCLKDVFFRLRKRLWGVNLLQNCWKN